MDLIRCTEKENKQERMVFRPVELNNINKLNQDLKKVWQHLHLRKIISLCSLFFILSRIYWVLCPFKAISYLYQRWVTNIYIELMLLTGHNSMPGAEVNLIWGWLCMSDSRDRRFLIIWAASQWCRFQRARNNIHSLALKSLAVPIQIFETG